MAAPVVARLASTLRASRRTTDPAETDGELLGRFVRTRDESAFRALVDRHAKTVLAACRQVLTDPADIDDAFQAAFVVLFRRARKAAEVAYLGGWLFAVAHRVSVRCRADNSRRQVRETTAAKRARTTVDPPDPSVRELSDVLHAELNSLPDKYRLPLILCCVRGLSRDEAATELGCTFEAVRWALERGRTLLQRRLTKRGVALSAGLLAAVVGGASAAGVPSPELITLAVRAATEGTSPAALALAHGAFPMFTLTRTALPAVVTLALIAVGVGLGVRPSSATADEKPAVKVDVKENTPATGRKVTGTVLTDDDKPLTAELVFLPKEGDATSLGRSNAKGEFSVRVPEQVTGTLLAVADGYGVHGTGVWSKMPTELTFRLPKGFPVRGRVLDLQGKPVAGATVTPLRATVAGAERTDEFLTSWAKIAPQEDAFGQSRGDVNFRSRPGFTPPGGKRMLIAVTDEDGKFELLGLGLEQVAELRVSGSGVADSYALVLTREGVDVDSINAAARKARATYMLAKPGPLPSTARLLGLAPVVTIEPEKPIRGVVTDDAGRPRANVPVVLRRLNDDELLLRPHTAVTDKEGKFTIRGSRRYETYRIETDADPKAGYKAAQTDAGDTAGLEAIEVVLVTPRADEKPVKKAEKPGEKKDAKPEKPTSVGGTVTGPDGKAVVGASVFVGYYRTGGMWAPGQERIVGTKVATTNKDGRFTAAVPKDAPAYFWVYATKPGLGAAWTEPEYPSPVLKEPTKLALKMPADQVIKGRVLNIEGKAVGGASVAVFTMMDPADRDMDKFLKATANGGFGSVGQWGNPLHPPAEQFGVTTAADGKFELTGIGGDRIVMLVVSGKGIARMSGLVLTHKGVNVASLNQQPAQSLRKGKGQHPVFYGPEPTFVVEPGYALEGVVTDAKTGKPVPGSTLDVSMGYWDRVTAVTDADGKYRVDGLSKGGGHYVHALPPTDRPLFPTFADVKDPDGFATATLNFPLARGAVFAGRAIDKQTGKPVAAAFQILPAADNEYAKRPEYETANRDMVWKGGSADGKFSIVTLPGKSNVNINVEPTETLNGRPLRVHVAGQKMTIDLKEEGNAEFTVEVERGKEVTLTAADADGQQLAGVVTAGQTLHDHGFVTEHEIHTLPTDEAKFTVYGLTPQEVRAVVVLHPEKKLAGSKLVTAKSEGQLTLRPLQPVRGAFTDTDGTPLVGVTVTIDYNLNGVSELFREHAPKWQMSAVTDKEGKFEIPDAIPGVPFTFDIRKGGVSYRGVPRLGAQTVPSGKPLELGVRKLEEAQ